MPPRSTLAKPTVYLTALSPSSLLAQPRLIRASMGPGKRPNLQACFVEALWPCGYAKGNETQAKVPNGALGVNSDREPTQLGRHIPFSFLRPPTSSLKHDWDVWTCSFHPEQLWKPCTKVVIKKDRRSWKSPFQPWITLFQKDSFYIEWNKFILFNPLLFGGFGFTQVNLIIIDTGCFKQTERATVRKKQSLPLPHTT